MLPLFDRTAGSAAVLPTLAADALARGAVILTSSHRAARVLLTAHAEAQTATTIDGAGAWSTPLIFEWSSWLATLWDQYTLSALLQSDPPTLLGPLQELQLWGRVLGPDRDRVVAPERMAELAQQAYERLGSYNAHPLRHSAASSPFGSPHQDAERFLVWAAAFDRLCERYSRLSPSRLAEQLLPHVAQLELPPELLLIGFDRVTPAQQTLLSAIAQLGTIVVRDEPAAAVAVPALYAASDPREEMQACAQWCRSLLLQAAGPVRIAVIVPELGRQRAALDRIFRRVLMPQTMLWPSEEKPAPSDSPMPYEFSLGTPLAQAPSVHAALLVLRWLSTPLPAAELTWLLTSGFLASSIEDEPALAHLDAELRRSRNAAPTVPLAAVLDRRHAAHQPPLVRRRLQAVAARAQREQLADHHRTRAHATWTGLASALLVEAGWPGARPLDSVAYQARRRWERLLTEMATLDFDGSQTTWTAFLETLSTAAHKTLFAPESRRPPIQIVGAYESSGQQFDAIWFLGVEDRHWPSAGRPHPLLPAWLQREAGMPHATPQTDWNLARDVTTRILAGAPTVVASYARQEQGIALRPSPLLPASEVLLPPAAVRGRMDGAAVELTYADEPLGEISWPLDRVAGGAEILKRQAACAFQSFATRRLEARPLEQAEQGLDAAERGTLMHQVLERLWSSTPDEPMRLHSGDDLTRAIANQSLSAMVAHHIDAAFAARTDDAGDPEQKDWQAAYLDCERTRVLERVLSWLTLEAERRPFTVFALEQDEKAIRVGALQLNLRPDRIDTLENATHLLLDYKTGKVEAAAWDGERPEEPQLPLYAVFGQVQDVSGVAFAQIRADATRLIVRAEDPAAHVSSSLGKASHKNRFDQALRDEWGAALVALADEFVAGDARVNPRDGAKTCKWCPLTALCRVHAGGLLPEEDEDEDTDADA